MTSGPKSALQQKAAELSACAHEIVDRLENHRGKPHQIEYGRALAKGLRPLVAAYDHAVFVARSREAAADALNEMNERVRHAGVSASKGEMDFDFGSAMNTYYELHTIFRDARYRSDSL